MAVYIPHIVSIDMHIPLWGAIKDDLDLDLDKDSESLEVDVRI